MTARISVTTLTSYLIQLIQRKRTGMIKAQTSTEDATNLVIFSASSKHFQGNRGKKKKKRKNNELKIKGTVQCNHPGKSSPLHTVLL